MSDPADLSTSDHALRYRAASCVASRWRVTETYLEEPAERVKRRIAFVETALQYIVAVLAAEHHLHPEARAHGWEELRGSLGEGGATLGVWAAAARDLSISVMSRPDPILIGVAGVLAVAGPGGKAGCSAADADLWRLVKLRNDLIHSGTIAAGTWVQFLDDSLGPFRSFLAALRAIGRHAPWVVSGSTRAKGEPRTYEMHCLRGTDQLPPRRVSVETDLIENVPFVVSPAGSVLYLAPLVQWQLFAPARGKELRVFSDWKKGPRFADPRGEAHPAVLGSASGLMPSAWLDEGFQSALQDRVFVRHSTDLPVLLDPERGESPPVVPGYRVGAALGHGGNGRVYLARRHEPEGQVAIKVLTPSLVVDHAARSRLKREYDLMGKIVHPNVARVYEFLPDTPAGPTLVMEYVLGTNLRNHVEAGRPPLRSAVRLIEQVLAGLAAAHEHGIVHRDVTPENVILTPEGNVKLLDFGIARVAGDERLTRTIDGLGKIGFAAPEQIATPHEAGPPADVFAAARLLGYLVTGSENRLEQLAALPGALQAIVRKATDEDPTRRFADARAFLRALAAAREVGWEGCPVSIGERLSPTFEVAGVFDALGDGLWRIGVRDGETGEHAAVVAERSTAAEAALKSRLKGLSARARDALKHPETQATQDGVQWCVLRAESAKSAVELFLGREPELAVSRVTVAAAPPPARSTTSAPTAVAVAGEWSPPAAPISRVEIPRPDGWLMLLSVIIWPLAVVSLFRWRNYQRQFALRPAPGGPLPPYLQGYRAMVGKQGTLGAAARLEALALIVIAQRHARGVGSLDAEKWATVGGAPLRAAWTVLALPAADHAPAHAAQLPPSGALAGAQAGVIALHRAITSGRRLGSKVEGRNATLAERLLLQLVMAGSAGLEPARLAPFVVQREEGWLILGVQP